MTVTREDLVKTLGLDAKDAKTDRAVYGEVMSINEDQTYQVSLNGSDTTVKCARLSGAKVGDTVLVEILANGYSVVTGTVGGDTDASDAQASAAAAVTAAGQAQSAAGQASTAASQALTKANEAEASASAASTAAAAAQTAADTADSKATAAGTAAAAAQSSADAAATAAATADSKADAASAAATRAETKADTATAAASRAETAAGNAETSASTANRAANNALTQLGTVEKVVDVLTWISEHATYKASTDTEVVAGKYYFTRSGSGTEADPYVYTVVASPSGSPASQNYYEIDDVDEAVSNYISTHLALTDEGLWVTNGDPESSTAWKVLIKNDGVYIIDENGEVVATYSDTITLGNPNDGATVEISKSKFSVNDSLGGNAFDVDMSASATQGTVTFGGDIQQFTSRTYGIRSSHSIQSLGDSITLVDNQVTFDMKSESVTGVQNLTRCSLTERTTRYVTIALTIPSSITLREGSTPINLTASLDIIAGGRTYSLAVTAKMTIENSQVTIRIEHSSAEADLFGSGFVTGRITYEGNQLVKKPVFTFGKRSGTSGAYSAVFGEGLEAKTANQTAIGKYNDNNQNNVFEIGNGTSNTSRSNAFTVDWSGNTEAAGDITDGSGNVLSDKADTSAIPTVNDATLTIQKNGTNVQTFTANASSNKTANITVPTKTSDLTNDSGFTGYPTAKVATGTEVKMSGLYVRRKVAVKDNISVTSGNYVDNSTSVSATGYTLLGVLGYSLSNATTSGTGGMYGYIGQLYCTGNTVYYRICNRNSSAIKVKIEMDLLYFKS